MKRLGKGLINNIIDKLPVEIHIPKYRFCGPGTKLNKRIIQTGINPLDDACKIHDIAYANPLTNRAEADKRLENSAWERVKSKDAKLSEKASAWVVTNAMKIKRKLGAGMKKKKNREIGFRKVVNAARKGMKKSNSDRINLMSKFALIAARKEIRGKKIKPHPRILKIPSISGGFLPAAIPVLAGLSALGSIVGGISGIAKAVNDFKRNSNSKSPIPITSGKGLFLKPYKNGYGILKKN